MPQVHAAETIGSSTNTDRPACTTPSCEYSGAASTSDRTSGLKPVFHRSTSRSSRPICSSLIVAPSISPASSPISGGIMNPSAATNCERGSFGMRTKDWPPSNRSATTAVRPSNCGFAARAAASCASTPAISSSARPGLPSARPARRVYSCHGAPHSGIAGGRGDGRGDPRQRLVLRVVHRRVEPDDQVRLEGGDLLVPVVRGAGERALVQHDRLRVAELVLRPWPGGVRVVAVPVRDRHRPDPHREHRVLVTEPDRDDALRSARDLGGALAVLDGERERARRAGRACSGRRRALGAPPPHAVSRPSAPSAPAPVSSRRRLR